MMTRVMVMMMIELFASSMIIAINNGKTYFRNRSEAYAITMMNKMMNIMMNMMMKFCDRKSGYYVLTHVLMVDSVWVKQVCFKHSVFVRACMRANTCVCV